MPSSHLILCRPLLLPPSIFPSIRVFSDESAFHIRWPKHWSFSIGPSNEYSGLISFRMGWLQLLLCKGLSRVLTRKTAFLKSPDNTEPVDDIGVQPLTTSHVDCVCPALPISHKIIASIKGRPSLTVQWLGLCFQGNRTRVQSLVRELGPRTPHCSTKIINTSKKIHTCQRALMSGKAILFLHSTDFPTQSKISLFILSEKSKS